MEIFSVLTLLGGLAMFLYGMRLMSDTLKSSSSGTLKKLLEQATSNVWKAFLLGMLVTALIQSSKATIVITSGLVAAGIMSLHQSLGVIVGAGVGTTITGQVIRLMDLDGSGNLFLKILQPSTLAPITLIVGIACLMFIKASNSKTIGSVFMGFGILFSGLLNMTSAVSSLSEAPMLVNVLSFLNNSPILGFLIGTIMAFILQSSSASIGILQTFSASGILVFKGIYATLAGIYLGDCITTAMVCAAGEGADAKRVGIVNFLYNIGKIGIIFLLVLIGYLTGFLNNLWSNPVNSGVIANANTVFNLIAAVTLLPLLGITEKFSKKIIKEEEFKFKYQETVSGLSPAFFTTPALALRSCYDVLCLMYSLAKTNLLKAFEIIRNYDEEKRKEILEEEDNIDYLKDQLSGYIIRLLPSLKNKDDVNVINQYHRVNSEFEHLGDISETLCNVIVTMKLENLKLSDMALKELDILEKLMYEILNDTERAFVEGDNDAAVRIEPLVSVAEEIIEALKEKHVKRMADGDCNIQIDSHYMNLLSDYKRACEICGTISLATIVRLHPELASLKHEYTTKLKEGERQEFNTIYMDAYRNYSKQLSSLEKEEKSNA